MTNYSLKLFRSIFFLIFSASFSLNAQTDSTDYDFEDIINDFVKESTDQIDAESSIDYFENLLNNPLDINTAGINELQTIPYINLQTAEIIVNHRKSYGPFFSKSELYSIKNIPQELVAKILPFVKVYLKMERQKKPIKDGNIFSTLGQNMKFTFRSRLSTDLQERKGFTDNKFAGSPYHIYNRLKINYGDNYSAGFLIEKDAGETSLADFSSFYLEFKNAGIIENIIVGDYQLQFGDGLALSGGYGISKGSNAVFPLAKEYFRSLPYGSSYESNFFRGLTCSLSLADFHFTTFFSANSFDAKIDSLSDEILSTPLGGYHRTSDEINSADKSSETLLGSSLCYHFTKNIAFGFLFYHTAFSNAFAQSGFKKSGSNFNYYSFYYNINFDNVFINGESAYDSRIVSSLASVQIAASKYFTFVTSFRNYPFDYINLHGSGFGERTGATNNELGYYSGFSWRTFLGTINFYFDQFYFPYATYDNPLPSSGNEFLFDLSSRFSKEINFHARLRREIKDISSNINNLTNVVPGLKYISKFELTYNVSEILKLKEIFSYNNYSIGRINSHEDGFLIAQEINYYVFNVLKIASRFCFFKAQSINSAVYEYENDLPGFLSSNIYTGEGTRLYFILNYEIYDKLEFSVKYSETLKPKDKSLGSGYLTIDGNLDNKVTMQMDWKL